MKKYRQSNFFHWITNGFTLIEVMVALAVVAVGMLAVSAALSRTISTSEGLEVRTIALWVASNKMAELRMNRVFVSSGSNESSVSMAGRNWIVVENYYSTPNPELSRIVVEVFPENENRSILSSTGYLALYEPPES